MIDSKECIDMLKQEKFIKYLNEYYLLLNDKPDLIEESQLDILKEILDKYKEIINYEQN